MYNNVVHCLREWGGVSLSLRGGPVPRPVPALSWRRLPGPVIWSRGFWSMGTRGLELLAEVHRHFLLIVLLLRAVEPVGGC